VDVPLVETQGCGPELDCMVAQHVQIPCPSCSHGLVIRVRDVGKKGECKYCGHRFKAVAQLKQRPVAEHGGASSRPGSDGPVLGLEECVRILEGEVRRSWTDLSTRQASLIEHLKDSLAVPAVQPHAPHGTQQTPSSPIAPEGPSAEFVDADQLDLRFDENSAPDIPYAHPLSGPTLARTDEESVADDTPRDDSFRVDEPANGIATPGIVDWLRDLLREREQATEECERLRRAVQELHCELARHQTENQRLRRTAGRFLAVRAERDQLNAERTLVAQEVRQLRNRLVETQVALVEVEAELDDCRERALAERPEVLRQRAELLDELERRLAEQRRELEAERQDWHERLSRSDVDLVVPLQSYE
jgi:hypothetical protein